MEASSSVASLFAGADVEADCLTFVEEIPQKEVEQIEVSTQYLKHCEECFKVNINIYFLQSIYILLSIN